MTSTTTITAKVAGAPSIDSSLSYFDVWEKAWRKDLRCAYKERIERDATEELRECAACLLAVRLLRIVYLGLNDAQRVCFDRFHNEHFETAFAKSETYLAGCNSLEIEA